MFNFYKKYSMVWGVLIRTDLTSEKIEFADEPGSGGMCKMMQTAVGGYFAIAGHSSNNNFVAYCDEEALLKNSGMNDLGAYVMDVLGVDIRQFSEGVRGNILILGRDKKDLSINELDALEWLCKIILDNNNDDADWRALCVEHPVYGPLLL